MRLAGVQCRHALTEAHSQEQGEDVPVLGTGGILQGGSISAEHGIGKIKVSFLALMYGEEGIAEMRALKMLFDPGMMLNPGNLF